MEDERECSVQHAYLNKCSYPEKHFERKFMAIIGSLGTYKIKMVKSYLLMPYFKIKLQCETKRFIYETIVVGDEFDDKAEARENVFKKAYFALQNKYKKDLEELGKIERKKLNFNSAGVA